MDEEENYDEIDFDDKEEEESTYLNPYKCRCNNCFWCLRVTWDDI